MTRRKAEVELSVIYGRWWLFLTLQWLRYLVAALIHAARH